MNMIIIEATRDIRQDAKRDPAAARRMKTLRRIYRLPPDFDITTLQVCVVGYHSYIKCNYRQVHPGAH